ncbi:Peroxisomal acyl-coenzyme A oxidase 1 [Seminavis robusta]|uniref:Acyl-coenzyme A oxidase n=1 Tax=Seminavis robusta TaxID=568900 RepID=A0A9N8ELZ6_9STRA|nr:Peroxisomal acyl-coenzyme A oxidase 1 [Seminavis robusta]|eukprot:Sro1308_g261470.1 Peroxisomal acyl-coenzyme A oxidase 1 (706) ;mRNA; r:14582-16699
MNEDLARERSKATFSVERITNLLDGCPHRRQRRRQLEAIIERDPVFSNDDNIYLSRKERHVRAIAKGVRLVEVCGKLGIGTQEERIFDSPDWLTLLNAIADDLPLGIHWVMFTPNIISLFDDEQQAKWLPQCLSFEMIGCYAQTELGHGSNIRALETTATFLPEAKGGMKGGSFVIHSPTLTSAKAWPGTLGRVGTHAIVIAQLIDGKGKNHGIHNFLVPLRSPDTHKPLPGVTSIDLGPKLGFNNMDNGLASFDHVVIPRRNMAMRFAHVDEQGNYSKKQVSRAASKIAYITMMQVRAHIIHEASKHLGIACTIAIRYSAVRRQGYNATDNDTAQELQILDYKQQQHRLFSSLAAAYCFFFSGKKVLARLNDMEARLAANKTMTKAETTDIHASSSALKCHTSTIAGDGLEDCRKACGGHGFLQCSGLPELVCTYVHHATVEGDNHMLPQQVAKVLLKLVQAVDGGQELSDYLNCDCGLLIPSIQSILGGDTPQFTCTASTEAELQSMSVLLAAFRHRAARLLVDIYRLMQTSMAEDGKSAQDAWNEALVEMARCTHAYAQFLLLYNFQVGLEDEAKRCTLGTSEIEVLSQLTLLCAFSWMERSMGDFLEDGCLTPEQSRWVRSGVRRLLDAIRPNAVALVDAFDISDFRLKSVLGRYDGNVYPALVEAAKRDPLNQTEPGPGCEQLLRLVGGGRVFTPTTSRL